MLRIHRSPLKRDYAMIPNATLRDPRLSFRARGVLVELLSRPNDWQTNADRLWDHARRHRGDRAEGQRAMRAVFAELEECGYLVKTKRRESDGRFTTIMDLYDLPRGGAGATSESGTPEGATSLPTTEDQGLKTNTDEIRSAHPELAAIDEDAFGKGTERPDDWREPDRELFAELLGAAKLRSKGKRWNAGVWPVEVFYDAFRKDSRNIEWPGRWLDAILCNEELESWLITEGLEPIVDEHRSR